jgi:pimeloyl-ACP methyl ester carboxylesterase
MILLLSTCVARDLPPLWRFNPSCGKTARERLRGPTWIALPGVGHNAMVDDPGLVAGTVLAVTGVEA